jgi:hypothetical protein
MSLPARRMVIAISVHFVRRLNTAIGGEAISGSQRGY